MTFTDELEKLNEAATPGPFENHHYGIRNRGGYIFAWNWPSHWDGQDERFQKETVGRESDGKLIVTIRNSLPALLKVLRAAEVCMLDASIIRADPPMTDEDWEEKLNRISQVLGDALAELERK